MKAIIGVILLIALANYAIASSLVRLDGPYPYPAKGAISHYGETVKVIEEHVEPLVLEYGPPKKVALEYGPPKTEELVSVPEIQIEYGPPENTYLPPPAPIPHTEYGQPIEHIEPPTTPFVPAPLPPPLPELPALPETPVIVIPPVAEYGPPPPLEPVPHLVYGPPPTTTTTTTTPPPPPPPTLPYPPKKIEGPYPAKVHSHYGAPLIATF